MPYSWGFVNIMFRVFRVGTNMLETARCRLKLQHTVMGAPFNACPEPTCCAAYLLLALQPANVPVPASQQAPQLFCFTLPAPPLLLSSACPDSNTAGMLGQLGLSLAQSCFQACYL